MSMPRTLVNFKLISSKQKYENPEKKIGKCWTPGDDDDDNWTEIKMFLMRFFVVRRGAQLRSARARARAGSIFRECSLRWCMNAMHRVRRFFFLLFYLFMASPMRITYKHKHHHPFTIHTRLELFRCYIPTGVPFACLFWRIELKRKGKKIIYLWFGAASNEAICSVLCSSIFLVVVRFTSWKLTVCASERDYYEIQYNMM